MASAKDKALNKAGELISFLNAKGEHQWQNTIAATALSGLNMITIRHRF